MYCHIWDLWGPANLVALTVTELDDTLPHLMDVTWDSVRATHGLSVKVLTWKMALGQGRTRPNSLIVIVKVATHGAFVAHVCCVVRSFPLQGCILIQASVTPSEMGDDMLATFKCRFMNFIIVGVLYPGYCGSSIMA
jgi:hypothetical protein